MSEKQDGILRWRGLNTTVDRSVLEPGELVRCRNVLARSGALRKRPGLLRLSSEETPRAWPPYVPPIDLPWVVQGDLWLRLVDVPEQVVVLDPWTLRIEAVNRAGKPVTTFDTGALVGLTVEGATAETWTGFTHLELAAGGAIDVTTGWVGGVWSASVVATESEDQTSLRLGLTYDSRLMDQEVVELAVLARLRVELPAQGVTPGVPFKAFVVAEDADEQTLTGFLGSRVTVEWTDGAEGALTVTDAEGAPVVATAGWAAGVAAWTVILPDRGTADHLRLWASAVAAQDGYDETDIVEDFALTWPESAGVQAFAEAELSIAAAGWTSLTRYGAREDFDGTGYSLKIERGDGTTWVEWDGLLTLTGMPPGLADGWNRGVWTETLRFETSAGSPRVRIALLRGAVEVAHVEGPLWQVYAAEIAAQGQVAAETAFPVSIAIEDEQGYAVAGFDGSLFTLTAHNEDDTAVWLTDAAGELLDFSSGWEFGVWSGQVMFASAQDGEQLHLVAMFDGVEIGTAVLTIGDAAPGEAHEFTVRLPTGVTAGVEFEVLLTAKDAFGALAADYAGEGLVLSWELTDDTTEAVKTAAVTLKDGQALTTGWDGGVWTGSCTLESAQGCETLTLTAVLDGVESGSAETPCALTFVLTTAKTVTTGNKYQLSIVATQADGLIAKTFTGEELVLTLYRASGSTWAEEAHGLNIGVGWTSGFWRKEATAGAVGQVKWELSHEDELEGDALVEIVALTDEDDVPDPPEEEAPVSLTLTVPEKVWPGVPFSLGVSASEGDYEGDGAMLTVTPTPTPAPVIGSGWSGGSWEHVGRLATPGTTGSMSVYLTWDPGTVSSDAVPGDFERREVVPIGTLVPVVVLPAKVRTGRRFTVTVRMTGAGAGLLSGYLGDGYEGVRIEVSADAGATWTPAVGALGTLATAPWTGGVLKPAGTLGAGFGVCNRLRVAGVVFGTAGEWAVAEVETAADAGQVLTVTWTGPDYLHLYGPAEPIAASVTNPQGVPVAPTAGQLELVVYAWKDAVLAPFLGLQDQNTGVPLSFATGWTGAEWCADALLSELAGEDRAVLRSLQGSLLSVALEVPLRADVEIAITAPASVLEWENFALTLTARDWEGLPLVRYGGENLVMTGESETAAEAALLDVETNAEPDFSTGWVDGVWTRQVYIAVVCADFWVRAVAADSAVVLDAEMIEVLDGEEMLLLDIRERQMATGRTVWAVDSTHTFAQYQAEVNALAPSFVAGTYTGGAALPTMQANTVASTATTLAELVPLVRAMLSTTRTVTFSSETSWRNESGGTGATRAAALASVSTGTTAGELAGGCVAAVVAFDDYYDLWHARKQGWHAQYVAGSLATSLGKSARFFGKATVANLSFIFDVNPEDIADTYDAFGLPGLPSAANVYGLLFEVAGSAGATSITSPLAGAGTGTTNHTWLPSTWPGYAATAEGGEELSCKIAAADCLALIDWEFSHV